MTNETKHTPTPWTTGYLGRHILCANDRLVGQLYSKEDAAHIVKCVNMHDELVEALKEIIDRSNNDPLGTSKVLDMRKIAEKALKKAGAL